MCVRERERERERERVSERAGDIHKHTSQRVKERKTDEVRETGQDKTGNERPIQTKKILPCSTPMPC